MLSIPYMDIAITYCSFATSVTIQNLAFFELLV